MSSGLEICDQVRQLVLGIIIYQGKNDYEKGGRSEAIRHRISTERISSLDVQTDNGRNSVMFKINDNMLINIMHLL